MIWRQGQIADTAAGTVEAAALIDSTLARRRIDLKGSAVWGQYLDDERYSDGQWGLLGTMAAVATLGLRARPPQGLRHLREALPLVPKSPTDYDPRIQAKVDKGDLENMVRLAFIAEALFPGESRVSAASRPEIVRHILELAGEDPYWHPTSARGGVPADGDPFTTAYVLFALRRYEDPRGEFRHYRSWLAQQLKTKSAVRARPDLVALIGLALIPDGVDPEEPAAIDQCKEELAAWSGRETIVLNRPLFHGFNLGEWTDYTFLHPEIVAALFLLRAGNPRSTRRYVAKVVGEVVENVKSHGYFEGQPGMGATVDQFWASKLLAEFQQINADPTRRQILLPVTVIRGWMRWLVVAVAAPIFALVVVFTSNPAWGAVGAVVGGVVIPMLINIIVNWAGNS